ncbi:hypothetical protein IA64_14410 [Xanthomonas arboricola pv. celebensis]|nr:hypothetical protein IA64_14410 [Xanthomonas arboricola pv. celebensis]
MLQGLGDAASAWRLLLAVNDQLASRGPGIADIALANQRLVRERLAHQPGKQLAGNFELLGMGGHENFYVWGKSSSNQEPQFAQELG